MAQPGFYVVLRPELRVSHFFRKYFTQWAVFLALPVCVISVKALQYQWMDGYTQAESKGIFCNEVGTLDDGVVILVDMKKLAAILKLKKNLSINEIIGGKAI